MELISPAHVSNEEKLKILRRLDQFRNWDSLDDKRYCLVCGKIITGHQIRLLGGTRGNGPLRVICPTERCHSIPMDWVLPTAEVLANITIEKAAHADVHAVRQDRDVQEKSARSVLRQLAAWLKRPASAAALEQR
jgi:hypothetical protein